MELDREDVVVVVVLHKADRAGVAGQIQVGGDTAPEQVGEERPERCHSGVVDVRVPDLERFVGRRGKSSGVT